MQAFPPELVDIILDFLFDDVLTLIKCSQVCRVWVPTSRYHLWNMRIAHFGAAPHSKTDRLVRLLSDPLSTLAPAVRRVCVGSISQQRDLMSLMDRITPCASVLQASRSLYLRAMTWKDIDDVSRILFASKFGSLTELVLSNIHFGTFADMIDVLSSFPALQRLCFVRVQWDGGLPPDATSLDSTFPELKTLEIDYGCQDILEWLRLCSPKFPRLSTIHLKLSEIIPSNQRFSPDFAPCLEHMELGFYRLYLESLRDFKVDLSKSRALRSIHISHLQLNELGLSGVDPLRNRVYVGWVPEVLGSVASPSVEKLHLSIWVTNVSDINLLDWTSLKQVFQRSDPNPFSSLNTLLLDMYGKMYDKVDRDAVEKTIHTALEGCRVFDLLKFRWH